MSDNNTKHRTDDFELGEESDCSGGTRGSIGGGVTVARSSAP